MNIFDIKYALEHITLYVDTREQPTAALKKRIAETGFPAERIKLNAGDYSCKCELPDGKEYDFSRIVAVERKMSIDEACSCFGKSRARFEREFERAKSNGTRLYLLIENGSWEDCLSGKYRSMLTPAALTASLIAWQARYDMRIMFCKKSTTGKMLKKILHYEVKEYLENIKDEIS